MEPSSLSRVIEYIVYTVVVTLLLTVITIAAASRLKIPLHHLTTNWPTWTASSKQEHGLQDQHRSSYRSDSVSYAMRSLMSALDSREMD